MERIEWHYTPKHGSWLNQMEVEWSALTRQRISRRIGDVEMWASEVAIWEAARKRTHVTIDWRFTPEQARTKLERLYPS